MESVKFQDLLLIPVAIVICLLTDPAIEPEIMGRRKPADERSDCEYEHGQLDSVHLEGEPSSLEADTERDGAKGVDMGVRSELGAGEARFGGDTGMEHGGANWGNSDGEVRDLLLHVSRNVSQITGALQHVVAVLQKKDSISDNVGAGGGQPGNKTLLDMGSGGDQTVNKTLSDTPRGAIEIVSEEEERNSCGLEGYRMERSAQSTRVDGREPVYGGVGQDRPGGDHSRDSRNRLEVDRQMQARGPEGRDERILQETRFRGDQLGTNRRNQSHEHEVGVNRNIKIPPFNGREEWQVWINRFEVIARRQGWSRDEKLDNLLPRLEGGAADLVFSQLPSHILNDYGLLVGELNNRYRRIETPRTFAAKFSSRNQKHGETAEEYAAELKKLYDRAHGYRDAATRQEDLVRRFLDGLWDEEARFEVEFHKEPTTIDEAVYFVVCYLQTKQRTGERQRKPVRETRKAHESQRNQGDLGSVGRIPNKTKAESGVRPEISKDVKRDEKRDQRPAQISERDETQGLLKLIMEKLNELASSGNSRPEQGQVEPARGREIICFRCGGKGHMARGCPNVPGDIIRQRGDKPWYQGASNQRRGESDRAQAGAFRQSAHLN